ncbi:MAG: S-methyl-5-thioribose-1-phosphate isomerase, partial [Pseudorhodoplanes sp.]
MKIAGQQTRSIWLEPDGRTVGIFDQTLIPHRIERLRLVSCADAARAIATMQTRGAPLIGAVAAYGMALAMREDTSDEAMERAHAAQLATRPTAINLKWALDEMLAALRNRP